MENNQREITPKIQYSCRDALSDRAKRKKKLIPSRNVLRVPCASLARRDSRVTRKFYVIQFASDAQSSFGSSRIAHGSLRDA